MKKIIILLFCFTNVLAQETEKKENKSTPLTTLACYKSVEHKLENYEVFNKCFKDFFSKQIQVNFNSNGLNDTIPFKINTRVKFHADENALIHLDTIAVYYHEVSKEFVAVLEERVKKCFKTINDYTNQGKGLAPERNREGNPKVKTELLPLVIDAGYFTEKELIQIKKDIEKKFDKKAIFAEKVNEKYMQFYQSLNSSSYFVYELNEETTENKLLQEYKNEEDFFKHYPHVKDKIVQSEYDIVYFFKDNGNRKNFFKIRYFEGEFQLRKIEGKEDWLNAIFENIISLYKSKYSEFILN